MRRKIDLSLLAGVVLAGFARLAMNTYAGIGEFHADGEQIEMPKHC
jgi:hypothetical protein